MKKFITFIGVALLAAVTNLAQPAPVVNTNSLQTFTWGALNATTLNVTTLTPTTVNATTLNVSGVSTHTGAMSAATNVTLAGPLTVTNNATLQGTLAVTGNSTFAGVSPNWINVGSGGAISKIIASTGTLDYGAIVTNTVANLTITAAGAGTNSYGVFLNTVAPNTNLVFKAYVSATNTVTVEARNVSITGGDVNPDAMSVGVIVFQP